MMPDALFLKETIHESHGQLVFPVMFLYKTFFPSDLCLIFIFLKKGLPPSQEKYCEIQFNTIK